MDKVYCVKNCGLDIKSCKAGDWYYTYESSFENKPIYYLYDMDKN